MTLIERLRKYERDIKNYDAPIDFVQHVTLESLLSTLPEIIETLERQEELLKMSKFHIGEPPIWLDEWFFGKLKGGNWCALKRLPEGYSYTYVTADETHLKNDMLIGWVQIPDSGYLPLDCTKCDIELKADIARKDKLLAEAKNLINDYCKIARPESHYKAKECLAALEEEGKGK